MSDRFVQFSPKGSTRVLRLQVHPVRWATSSASPSAGLVRAWFEHDSEFTGHHNRNWGALSGLALSLAISAGFWIGLGMLVVRLLK